MNTIEIIGLVLYYILYAIIIIPLILFFLLSIIQGTKDLLSGTKEEDLPGDTDK